MKVVCLILLVVLLAVPVGATVITVTAPDTNADAKVSNVVTQTDFSTLRNGTGNTIVNATATITLAGLVAGTTTNKYTTLVRYIWSGNTSVIPDGATVTAANFSVHGAGTNTIGLGQLNVGITGCTPADPSLISATDYSTFQDTRFASDVLFYTWTTGWNNWSLNSAGLSAINKTGFTCLMLRMPQDIDNSLTGITWANGAYSTMQGNETSTTTAGAKPVLTITYTLSPVASFISNTTAGDTPLHVQFTDESTGSPSSWNWSFGDGTYSDEQNPSHIFTGYNLFNVTLNATNGDGSGEFSNRIGVVDPNGVFDNFALNSSSNYGNENSRYIWDTANEVLNATSVKNAAYAQTYYKSSPFFNGTYSYNVTIKSWDSLLSNDVFGEFIFGSQSLSTGTWWSDGVPKYATYIRKDVGGLGEEFSFAVVHADGSHDQLTHNYMTYELNHTYNVTTVWNPFAATCREVTYLDGVQQWCLNDTYVNTSGWAGFTIHTAANSTLWYDNLRINNNTSDTPLPIASFTTNITSGTVPLAVAFTDTSTNSPTGWNWSFGDGNWSNGTANAVSYLYEYPGTYNAFLIARNDGGSSQSASTVITASALPVSLQCQNQTGNITISLFSNSTSTLGWNWQDPGNITKIAEDGLYVLSFDNSSDYFIGTGYLPETWHKLKIYNQTDFGQLNCTTDAVPVTPTPIPIMPSTESNVDPINIFSYWPVAIFALGFLVVFVKW